MWKFDSICFPGWRFKIILMVNITKYFHRKYLYDLFLLTLGEVFIRTPKENWILTFDHRNIWCVVSNLISILTIVAAVAWWSNVWVGVGIPSCSVQTSRSIMIYVWWLWCAGVISVVQWWWVVCINAWKMWIFVIWIVMIEVVMIVWMNVWKVARKWVRADRVGMMSLWSFRFYFMMG